MVSILEYPSIDVIKDVGSDELKSNHAPQRAPSKIILEVPHARIANHEPALPSDVILQISVHRHHVNTWTLTCHLLVCSKLRHVCQVGGS